ncbi:MAG: tail fiber domain-containing protein [Bacilli bacterium]|nr:tail fiber domain-containing protein [Bacilli bacterium]
MASLKQTKIYGALEVYNGENKVNITVDPQNYPNGIMSIGRINVGDISIDNRCISIDGIDIDLGPNDEVEIHAPIIVGAVNIDGIEMYKTGDDSLAITYPIATEHVNAITIDTSRISNIHSIEFDGIIGSKISNLYDLTLNSNGVINFGNNGLSLNKTSISNLGTLSFGSSDTTATLLWSGTTLSINQPLSFGNQANHSSVAKDKIEVGAGSDSNGESPKRSTLTSTKIENVYTDNSGESKVTIENGKKISFTDPSNNTATLSWNGTKLALNSSLSIQNALLSNRFELSRGDEAELRLISSNSDDYDCGIIIGSPSNVAKDRGIAIGMRHVDSYGAILNESYAGEVSVAINGSAGGPYGIAINGISDGESNIAIGYLSRAQNAINAIALGYNASCDVDGCIALGPNAVASEASGKKTLTLPYGYSSTLNITQPSDRNDKTNIEDVEQECLPLIKKLKPVTFRYNYRDDYRKENPDPKYLDIYGLSEYDKDEHKKATKAGERTHIGFIAQDVKSALEETYPGEDKFDIVSIAGYKLPSFKENATDEEYKKYTMNYIGLIPVLVKAMQEQQAEIEELKAEITKLKK